MADEKREVTARDLAVWGAYADSALALPLMAENEEERDALLKARTALSEGKTTGLLKAVKDALKVCVPDTTAHPVRQGEVRRAATNLEAIVTDLTGEPAEGAAEPAKPVCIHCGKSYAHDRSLAKHIASKHP